MKTNLNKIITILIAIFWILNTFYLLFLGREYYPTLLLQIILIITFLIQVCYLLRKNKSKFIKKCVLIYNDFFYYIYLKPLNIFFESFIKPMPYIGNVLMFFCLLVVKIYAFIGKHAISICCMLFFVFPQIMLLFLLTIKVLFQVHLNYSIICTIVVLRFTKSFFNLILDFSLKNKLVLQKYLIIEKKNNNLYYDFHKDTVKNKTQEKLNLYVYRFRLFEEVYNLTQSTVDYKIKNIAPTLNAVSLAFFMCLNLKLLLLFLFAININHYFYMILFMIICIVEYKNMSQDTFEKFN